MTQPWDSTLQGSTGSYLDPIFFNNLFYSGSRWSSSTFRLCERLWRRDFDANDDDRDDFTAETNEAWALTKARRLELLERQRAT